MAIPESNSIDTSILILAEKLGDLYPGQRKPDHYINKLLQFMRDEWKPVKLQLAQLIYDEAWQGRRELVIQRLFGAEDALSKGLLAGVPKPLLKAQGGIPVVHLRVISEARRKFGSLGSGQVKDPRGALVDLFFDPFGADEYDEILQEWGEASVHLQNFSMVKRKMPAGFHGLVARDKGGDIQGAMVFQRSPKNRVISLHFMETAPFNMGKAGYSGVGTNMLARASAEVPKGGKLILQGGSAKPFFRKAGMTEGGGADFQFGFTQAKSFADEVGVSKSPRRAKVFPDSIDLTNDPAIQLQILSKADRITGNYQTRVLSQIGDLTAQATADAGISLATGRRNATSILLSREGLQEVVDNFTWQAGFVDDLTLSTHQRIQRLLQSRYGSLPDMQASVRKTFRIDRDDLIAEFRDAVSTHAKDVIEGRINAAVFERRMQGSIQTHYGKLFRAGKGSPLNAADRVLLRQQIRSQNTYLANFREYIVKQQALGTPLSGRVRSRALLYAERGGAMYERGIFGLFSDDALIDWVMGAAEHCATCPVYAGNSPYTKETLPGMPGAGFHLTICGTNCQCHLELSPLYVQEEAIGEAVDLNFDVGDNPTALGTADLAVRGIEQVAREMNYEDFQQHYLAQEVRLFQTNRDQAYKQRDAFAAKLGKKDFTAMDVWYNARNLTPEIYQKGKISLQVASPDVLAKLKDDDLPIISGLLDYIGQQYPDKALAISLGAQPISMANRGGFRFVIPYDHDADLLFLYDPKVKPKLAALQKSHGNKPVNTAFDMFRELGHSLEISDDEAELDRFSLGMAQGYFKPNKG